MTISDTRIKEQLTALGFNVYPIVADQGADVPFVTYRRTGSETSKDDITSLTYEVVLVGGTYAKSVEMVNTLLSSEFFEDYTDEGEDYSDGYYMQTISLTIEN